MQSGDVPAASEPLIPMDPVDNGRRTFLRTCSYGASMAALAGLATPLTDSLRQQPPLQRCLDEATGLPLLRLPAGFEFRSFGWTGDVMSDGRPTPPEHDGMAVVAASGSVLALVRNHEVVSDHGAFGCAEMTYDPAAAGGTTTLQFDAAAGRLISARASLSGTLMNCGGGPTPWGSWLSCEEAVADAGAWYGAYPLTRLSRDHGFVFEVAADGSVPPRPIEAMGRFCHEAAAVDPTSGIVYLTEDLDEVSGFYRFIPAEPGNLHAGGRLQMMSVEGRRQMISGVPPGKFDVSWIDIEDPLRGHRDPAARDKAGVVSQGLAAGGTGFQRLEGCWFAGGLVFFSSTSGGDTGYGQIFVHDASSQTVRKLFESPDTVALDQPDNLTISPNGAVVICEDGSRYGQMMLGLSASGELIPIAQNNVELNGEHSGLRGDFRYGEWAGACFSPDGRWLFANIQRPGISFAITGPWERLLA